MIKEAYVSLEVAKLLKEKGFVESCYGRYSIRSKEFHLDTTKPCNNGSNFLYCAPTHQMAMAWLREVHKVFISIDAYTANHWDRYIDTFEIDIFKNASRIMVPREIAIHNIYEEAVETALKYALENLI